MTISTIASIFSFLSTSPLSYREEVMAINAIAPDVYAAFAIEAFAIAGGDGWEFARLMLDEDDVYFG